MKLLTMLFCSNILAAGTLIPVLDSTSPVMGTSVPTGTVQTRLFSFELSAVGSSFSVLELDLTSTGTAGPVTNVSLYTDSTLLAMRPNFGNFFLAGMTIVEGSFIRFDVRADLPTNATVGSFTPILMGGSSIDLSTSAAYNFGGVTGNQIFFGQTVPEPGTALLLVLGVSATLMLKKIRV